jgi:hypothetical protein
VTVLTRWVQQSLENHWFYAQMALRAVFTFTTANTLHTHCLDCVAVVVNSRYTVVHSHPSRPAFFRASWQLVGASRRVWWGSWPSVGFLVLGPVQRLNL